MSVNSFTLASLAGAASAAAPWPILTPTAFPGKLQKSQKLIHTESISLYYCYYLIAT